MHRILTCVLDTTNLAPKQNLAKSRQICCPGLARCNVSEKVKPAALDSERMQTMPYSISTLLTRNLQEVFGENDPARRRAAVQELYTDDGVFYDPSKGVYRGRDEIDRIAGEIRATHLDFRYQPIAEPEETGNGGRVRWVAGRPGEAPAYAGTDFIIARDGRIAALYLFFDKLP
jgi:SnoaL-like domain